MFSDNLAKYRRQWITLRAHDDRHGHLWNLMEICEKCFITINYARSVSSFVDIFNDCIILRYASFRGHQSFLGGKVHGTSKCCALATALWRLIDLGCRNSDKL